MGVRRDQSARPRRDSGFTLIEVLVVIGILGILAAIATPMFLGARTSATDVAVKSDVTALKKAVLAYRMANNGAYVAVTALKKDGYSGPSLAYGTSASPSYATAAGVTATPPSTTAEHFCVAATSPTGAQWFATDERSVSKVGGGLNLCD